MKAIIQYNLPEDEREYKVANQAGDVLHFIWEFNQQLRSWDKYGHSFKDADDAVDKIRQEFYDILNRHPNIDIDL